jgi:hypothetical protein
MSTWRIEDGEEVKDAEEVEDRDSAAESCLARKLASFGMVAVRYYTARRTSSEELAYVRSRVRSLAFSQHQEAVPSLTERFLRFIHGTIEFQEFNRFRTRAILIRDDKVIEVVVLQR